ncbi:MAG TPA: hypothetical protein VNN22_11805 [Verrucomicrobiae bacterium]|nr:hypothetical protein [Verrucomicrobiae bacterium]
MKFVTALIYFVVMASAMAQNKMAPIPSVIIIYSTNQPGAITLILPEADSKRQDFEKQRSEYINLKLTCVSAKSVTTKREGEKVSLVVRSATVYGHAVMDGKYGDDQILQKMTTDELTWNLDKLSLVQVNGEIFNADSFAQKFKAIP